MVMNRSMDDPTWPPRSPFAALLSSPSGRRKHHQSQCRRERSLSPTKHSSSRPDLQLASRKLFVDAEERNPTDDAEEDEETLQLKLAAIEAKLKLKKLKQQREKDAINPSGDGQSHSGSKSSTSNNSTVRAFQNHDRVGSKTEVPVSPTKRSVPQSEQRSPSRVLLGIDKGIKGTDVSLRRAKSVREDMRSHTPYHTQKRQRLAPDADSSRSKSSARQMKTFSERIAETRAREQNEESKREAMAKRRNVGFQLDHAEMETFQRAAAEVRAHRSTRSPSKDTTCTTFSREEIVRSQYEKLRDDQLRKQKFSTPKLGAEASKLKSATKKPEAAASDSREDQRSQTPSHANIFYTETEENTSLYDSFSQLRLSARVLPHSFLERTFPTESHTCIRLPELLRQVQAPAYELPGLETRDIVIVGVVASKSDPLDRKGEVGSDASEETSSKNKWESKWEDGSQNQKKFMVLQVSDLRWSVDLYLFGTALPKYHRITPGTVVAILNPGIMPPRKGREDTGAFSLTLHHGEDTILEIGTAKDLGFCGALKRDGKQCENWVDLTKTEVCEWHLHAKVTQTQAARMGVNTGSNVISRDGTGSRPRNRDMANGFNERVTGQDLLPNHPVQKFDRESQSHYFMTPSNAAHKSMNRVKHGEFFERSAASLMDLDDDDPFIAAGRLSRDTETRMKKRLATQEREREIALKLGSMGSGGAGGEYLRHHARPNSQTEDSTAGGSSEAMDRKRSATATKDEILRPTSNVNGKRTADSVRLSPIKKTRFVTKKGVREAGRESHGGKRVDHDSDLDIV